MRKAFEEDKDMIEAQQIIVNENADMAMSYIHFDTGLTQGRKLLDKALAEESAYFNKQKASA